VDLHAFRSSPRPWLRLSSASSRPSTWRTWLGASPTPTPAMLRSARRWESDSGLSSFERSHAWRSGASSWRAGGSRWSDADQYVKRCVLAPTRRELLNPPVAVVTRSCRVPPERRGIADRARPSTSSRVVLAWRSVRSSPARAITDGAARRSGLWHPACGEGGDRAEPSSDPSVDGLLGTLRVRRAHPIDERPPSSRRPSPLTQPVRARRCPRTRWSTGGRRRGRWCRRGTS
jgi:hypothetical protein